MIYQADLSEHTRQMAHTQLSMLTPKHGFAKKQFIATSLSTNQAEQNANDGWLHFRWCYEMRGWDNFVVCDFMNFEAPFPLQICKNLSRSHGTQVSPGSRHRTALRFRETNREIGTLIGHSLIAPISQNLAAYAMPVWKISMMKRDERRWYYVRDSSTPRRGILILWKNKTTNWTKPNRTDTTMKMAWRNNNF